ncbi:MAG: hypothetical protein AAF757_19360 [Cyanobacteria bacterium P01_D01_bin.116]
MVSKKYSRLFRLTVRFIKYFFLVIIGLSIAFVLATGVVDFAVAQMLLPFVVAGIKRTGTLLLCLIVITMIIESLR